MQQNWQDLLWGTAQNFANGWLQSLNKSGQQQAPAPAPAPAPAIAQAPQTDWKKWAIIGGVALVVVFLVVKLARR